MFIECSGKTKGQAVSRAVNKEARKAVRHEASMLRHHPRRRRYRWFTTRRTSERRRRQLRHRGTFLGTLHLCEVFRAKSGKRRWKEAAFSGRNDITDCRLNLICYDVNQLIFSNLKQQPLQTPPPLVSDPNVMKTPAVKSTPSFLGIVLRSALKRFISEKKHGRKDGEDSDNTLTDVGLLYVYEESLMVSVAIFSFQMRCQK